MADRVFELLPKSWIKFSVIDVEPYNPEISIFVRSSRDDTHYVEEIYEHGYFDYLGVVGNSTEPLRLNKYLATNDTPYYSEDLTIVVSPGDTLEYNYFY